jgi:hypothetical protein
VIGVRTPTAIVIGADSKLGRGDAPGSLGNGCKIGIANKVVWAYAGTLAVDGTPYSLEQAARRIMSEDATFNQRLDKFQSWALEQLADIIPRLKSGDPKYYYEHIDGRSFSEIIFATNDNGVLRMSKREFVCYQGDDGKVSVVSEEFPSPQHPESGWTALGKKEGVGKNVRANPHLFAKSLEGGIKFLIRKQIKTNPTDTGLPIAIVRIEKTTIDRKQYGTCPKQ